jgi:hypothetical protein
MATAIRVRMYRTGFGDCFLLTFGSPGRHVLVDFGVHMHGDIGTMDDVMRLIEEHTASKLELIVATHAHRDHISGFGKFAERFAKFEIGEIWLPWTDDPKDTKASAVRRKHLALYHALDTHLRVALGATESQPRYAAALEALSNLKGNETATTELARGFGTGATVRYLAAGASIPKVGDIAGLSADILAPARDASFLARMNPPADQHYLTAPGDTSDLLRPFPSLEIRVGEADYTTIVGLGQPQLLPPQLDTLHELAEAPAERLALALDNVRNNTSLVILFRFRGKALLLPGDAQWGNWQSWIESDTARDVIGGVDFLKLAHHGSENATPVDVVKALRASGVGAMVSTQVKPFPTIPRKPLLTAVEAHCGVAVRSDWIAVPGAPEGPTPIPKLPKGFKTGKLWIDYTL